MFSMLNKIKYLYGIFRNIKTDIQVYSFKMLLPKNQHHDDVWLVEFPKSGVTWLTFLIANVNCKMTNRNVNVNFYNINDFVPDIHVSRYLKDDLALYPGYRFIKSHSLYNPFYYKVIYLIRDPRSVMVSYYNFLVGLQSYSGSISTLIRGKKYGIDAWIKHVSGWLYDVSPDKRIFFIKYEDLLKDTTGCLSNLYCHLGLNVPETVLKNAVESSSKNKMKELERAWKNGDVKFRAILKDFQFVREGGASNYLNTLSSEDVKYINYKAGELMKMFGYL